MTTMLTIQTERMEVFELSEIQTFVTAMFQKNSEHCNSASQSLDLTTFSKANKLSPIKSVNEMTGKDV